MQKKNMNKRKRILNLYTLISFLFLILGLEFFWYIYDGTSNLLKWIPFEFVRENEIYVYYGIQILIFFVGIVAAVIAIQNNIEKKISIIIMLLNIIGCVVTTSIMGLGIYHDYKKNKEAFTKYQEKNIAQSKEENTENESLNKDADSEIKVETEVEENNSDDLSIEKADQTSNSEETNEAISQNVQDNSEVEAEESYQQQDQNLENENTEKKSRYVYEYGGGLRTWEDAYRRCKEDNAHLVTFETKEEFDDVAENLTKMGYQKYIFYIGGRRDMDSRQYYWIDENTNLTGEGLNNAESWTSEFWLPGEPSFRDEMLDVEEHVMCMFYKEDLGRWVWNDVPNDLVGAVPEYDGKIGIIYEHED